MCLPHITYNTELGEKENPLVPCPSLPRTRAAWDGAARATTRRGVPCRGGRSAARGYRPAGGPHRTAFPLTRVLLVSACALLLWQAAQPGAAAGFYNPRMRLNRELCLAELHAALQPGPWRAGGPSGGGGGDGLGAEGHDIRVLDAFAASGALAVPASRSETRAPSHAPEASATATLLQGKGPLRPQALSGSPCLAVTSLGWHEPAVPSALQPLLQVRIALEVAPRHDHRLEVRLQRVCSACTARVPRVYRCA